MGFIYKGYLITPIDSPDDGGWYCEVSDKDGKEVVDTQICQSQEYSISEAKRLIDERL